LTRADMLHLLYAEIGISSASTHQDVLLRKPNPS
jgi:hypothetical protein